MYEKKNVTERKRTARQLDDAELDIVVGGLNPQPLPPDHMPRLPPVLWF
jgi:hypothetical protein